MPSPSLTNALKSFGNHILLMTTEIRISTPFCQQLGMRAFFNDCSMIEKHNLIGIANGGKAMSDHQCGPSLN